VVTSKGCFLAESCSAIFFIDLTSPDVAWAIFRSLEPETRVLAGMRSRVRVVTRRRVLILRFEAKDVSALRAALNSYLRWVNMLVKVLGYIEG